MSSHRSTAMMSTPRSANAAACDRPWPPRELTRPLLPHGRSSRGFPAAEAAGGADGRAGIDNERGTSDVASGVADQIEDRFGHVLRLNECDVEQVQAFHSGLGVCEGGILLAREQVEAGLVQDEIGRHPARMDG